MNGAPDVGTVDAILARVANNPAALLSDEILSLAEGLSELDGARLRARLSDVKIKTQDFARIVKARQRSSAKAHNGQSRSYQGTWRDRLRPDRMTGCPRASFFNLKLILEHEYAKRLSFDEMAAVPLLDGKPLEDSVLAGIRCSLEETEDLEFSRADVADAIVLVARQHAFHPVRRYLDSLKWDGVKRLGKVAADYFGAEDKLSAKLVVRFFISAVARARSPGAKVDNAIVLFGDEGLKKSTFFRVLGGDHFKDSKVDITDRKGMMLMHSAWIYEWPEIDRMLEKRHDSDVKGFVTQEDDSFVPMYGRAVITLKRSNITVGTTNKEKFITSDTGSRRWWVVTVRKRIDADRLRSERDQLWAEACALYEKYLECEKTPATRGDNNPYRWHLNENEEVARAERNEEHLTASPDEESVDAWLRGDPVTCAACKGTGNGTGRDIGGSPHPCPTCAGQKQIVRGELAKDEAGKEYVTLSQVLDWPLGVPLERHEANVGRATRTLRRLGWRSGKRIRTGGRTGPRVTPYYAPPDPAEVGERAAIEGRT